MSSEKLTWTAILQYDGKPPENKALPRASSVQRRYGGYLGALKKQGTTIDQDIMNRIIENHQNQQIIVTKNDFPYDVDDGILHLVAWINPLMYTTNSNVELESYARNYVSSLISKDAEFILFENLPNNKSVHNIHHYQLFVRGDVGLLPIEKL